MQQGVGVQDGAVRCGVVWRGVAWCGAVWRGVAWHGVVWCDAAVGCMTTRCEAVDAMRRWVVRQRHAKRSMRDDATLLIVT